ncbi:hypothetical protein I3J27_30425 [Bradyrhizobium xenonodulans]|uniref:Uncharacterized protein n=1 Tax=Bradyrhizobium xenonodulans TaxID=2736875 RepID=A0ABY7MIE5_9BRAD|nr:hypothetical protein [Bradyrhizobium xenonodulans]WBL77298.1 hypothetical protein I3J27_30425 [Bradyrhizobium xenonodulans]
MNFQVTVLKILVSYPDGFAVMADLKRDMAILATSGRDWAERTKRLAARAPDLDIFSQGLVERLNGGWRITEKGRGLLELMEARPGEPVPASELPAAEPLPAPRLHDSVRLGRAQRRQRRRAARDRARAKAS